LLKTKGYLRHTFASAGKVYQPKTSQVNVKILEEEISLVDLKKHIKLNLLPQNLQLVFHKVKSENLEIEIPEVKLYDLKGENFQIHPFIL
jgi:hypothetical protein